MQVQLLSIANYRITMREAGPGGRRSLGVWPEGSRAAQPDQAANFGGRTITVDNEGNGGRTWTEPGILSDDDPKDMFVSVIPMISVAPNGRLDVAFWDTRSDPDIRGNDVYYTYSNDDGKTWSRN